MLGQLIVSCGAVLAICAATLADYQGLSVERHTTVNIAGITRDVFRVYAQFSNPDDYVFAGAGTPSLGPMLIESRNFDNTAVGGPFYNHPFGGNRAPTQEAIDADPNTAWDSFFTIGVSIADQAPNGDQMYFSAGFPFLAGTSVTTSNAAWLITPDHPQAYAGFAGDGDPLLRVLMIQLTVNSGNHVRGTMALSYRLSGQGTSTEVGGQTFDSFPAPGTVPVLISASLFGFSRRRRT